MEPTKPFITLQASERARKLLLFALSCFAPSFSLSLSLLPASGRSRRWMHQYNGAAAASKPTHSHICTTNLTHNIYTNSHPAAHFVCWQLQPRQESILVIQKKEAGSVGISYGNGDSNWK